MGPGTKCEKQADNDKLANTFVIHRLCPMVDAGIPDFNDEQEDVDQLEGTNHIHFDIFHMTDIFSPTNTIRW